MSSRRSVPVTHPRFVDKSRHESSLDKDVQPYFKKAIACAVILDACVIVRNNCYFKKMCAVCGERDASEKTLQVNFNELINKEFIHTGIIRETMFLTMAALKYPSILTVERLQTMINKWPPRMSQTNPVFQPGEIKNDFLGQCTSGVESLSLDFILLATRYETLIQFAGLRNALFGLTKTEMWFTFSAEVAKAMQTQTKTAGDSFNPEDFTLGYLHTFISICEEVSKDVSRKYSTNVKTIKVTPSVQLYNMLHKFLSSQKISSTISSLMETACAREANFALADVPKLLHYFLSALSNKKFVWVADDVYLRDTALSVWTYNGTHGAGSESADPFSVEPQSSIIQTTTKRQVVRRAQPTGGAGGSTPDGVASGIGLQKPKTEPHPNSDTDPGFKRLMKMLACAPLAEKKGLKTLYDMGALNGRTVTVCRATECGRDASKTIFPFLCTVEMATETSSLTRGIQRPS